MAVDPNSLTTLANLKTYLGVSGSGDDTLLEQCIDRASAMVEQVLGRPIKERSLYEWHTCLGTRSIGVKVRPIAAVRYVAFGTTNALWVRSTVATDTLATIEVTTSRVTMFRVDANGSESTDHANFANHQTTTELATHISTVTGFTATAIENFSAYQLHPRAGVNLLESTGYLTAAWDTSADLRVDNEAGIIHMVKDAWPSDFATRRFPAAPVSVLVAYTGGHATVPYDIEQVAIETAGALFRERKRDRSVASESLGDYSYSVGTANELVSSIRTRLGSRTRIR